MKNIPSIIDGIEFIVNGNIKVTSKEIAEKFDRQHKNVLQAINNLE
ncbi:MAG: Rha family transcriptional regulator, partial [archaeon]|nr:Rha family transcriptional regulator [archaeon]